MAEESDEFMSIREATITDSEDISFDQALKELKEEEEVEKQLTLWKQHEHDPKKSKEADRGGSRNTGEPDFHSNTASRPKSVVVQTEHGDKTGGNKCTPPLRPPTEQINQKRSGYELTSHYNTGYQHHKYRDTNQQYRHRP